MEPLAPGDPGHPAGQYLLGFYLIQSGSAVQGRSSNPRHVVGQDPLAFFSMPTAHPDRFDPLHGAWQSSGGARGVDAGLIEAGGLTALPCARPFTWQAQDSDDDGDTLTYRLLEGPAGAQIDAASGVLRGESPQAGEQSFRVEVDDGRGGGVEQRSTVRFAARSTVVGSPPGTTVIATAGSASAGPAGRANDASRIVRGPSDAKSPAVNIDWSSAQPACFSGAPLVRRPWLVEFLGGTPRAQSAADGPSLPIRLER
ncbi:MAG: hypothetical protein KA223_04630 [Candidatus Accumulibacter sp.]|nr:hypothetical protein [Accumulibacter sp.]